MQNNVEIDPEDFSEEAAKEFQEEFRKMNSVYTLTLEDDRWTGRGLGLDPEDIELLKKEQLEEAAKLKETEEEEIERLRKVANPYFWDD